MAGCGGAGSKRLFLDNSHIGNLYGSEHSCSALGGSIPGSGLRSTVDRGWNAYQERAKSECGAKEGSAAGFGPEVDGAEVKARSIHFGDRQRY